MTLLLEDLLLLYMLSCPTVLSDKGIFSRQKSWVGNNKVNYTNKKVLDDYSVIGRSLFKKETNIQIFVGLKVKLSTGEDGVIEGGFGQSGKFKIRIPNGLKPDTKVFLTVPSKKKSKAGKGDTAKEDESSKVDSAQPVTISLLFKRYVFDTQKKMIQS